MEFPSCGRGRSNRRLGGAELSLFFPPPGCPNWGNNDLPSPLPSPGTIIIVELEIDSNRSSITRSDIVKKNIWKENGLKLVVSCMF